MAHDLADRIPSADLAVLLGVTEREIDEHLAQQPPDRPGDLPPEWIRQGRRRCSEYRAWTGDDNIFRGIAWWRANPNGGR